MLKLIISNEKNEPEFSYNNRCCCEFIYIYLRLLQDSKLPSKTDEITKLAEHQSRREFEINEEVVKKGTKNFEAKLIKYVVLNMVPPLICLFIFLLLIPLELSSLIILFGLLMVLSAFFRGL